MLKFWDLLLLVMIVDRAKGDSIGNVLLLLLLLLEIGLILIVSPLSIVGRVVMATGVVKMVY